jgi:NAD(P)-dependent dehydrogenase (short-subunit alcohol dehydrogenase family)
MDFAADAGGGIDVVFNNAGAPGAHQKIDEISATLWDQTMVLLLRAPAMGIRHAVPHMKHRPGAAIVNTASVAGMRTGLGHTAYSVAKAGVLQLTRVAAVELAQYGIRVNAVCPGLIPTNLFSVVLNASDTEFQRLRPRLLEAASRAQPVARAGSPEDVAAAVAFLASADAGFITGEHIVIDGGVTLGERRAWDPKAQGPLDFNYIRSG